MAWPYVLAAAGILLVLLLFLIEDGEVNATVQSQEMGTVGSFLYGVCLLLGALAVSRVLRVEIFLMVAIGVSKFLGDRGLLRVDWGLLATFFVFFIFVGNLGAMAGVRTTVEGLVGAHPMATALLLSQVMSNVPATLFLFPFTKNLPALFLGVNLGGLGTLIASMASLISYRMVRRESLLGTKDYLLTFTFYNLLVLGLLLLLTLL